MLCVGSKIRICALHLNIFSCELEGKEGVNRIKGEDLRRAVEQDAHGRIETALRFEQYLTAGAAGGDGGGEKLSWCVGGGNGKDEYGTLGVAGVGVENGATLGTGATGIGGVLLIASADDFAVV